LLGAIIIQQDKRIKRLKQEMQEVKAEIRSIKRKNNNVEDNKVEDDKAIKNTAPKKKRVRFH
jgi:uncharacterized membrane protein (DUF106 family)